MGEIIAILGRVKVVIELTPSLKRFTDPKSNDSHDFKSYLLRLLNDLIADLRIPAEISLVVRLGDDEKGFAMSSYQVVINDMKCRHPLPTIVPQDVQAKELARSVAWVIHQNRELVITVPLTEKIREVWSSENGEPYLPVLSEERFHEFLSALVRRGFRIVRGKAIAQNSKEKRQSVWSAKECFEEAVSGLDTTIRFFLNDEGVKTRSAADDNKPLEEMFGLMQDGLFYELGIILPEVKIDTDESLDENEFRIQLNDVRFPSNSGLARDQFLVNDTSDRLHLLNLTGKSAVNPANGSECAIVQDEDAALEICREAGLTTWGPAGFVLLSLSAEVRRNAGNFLTTGVVKFSMDRLSEAFSDLVDTALKRFDIVVLTPILRDLLDEELSIRDLRGILEALLAINGTSDVDQSKNLVFSPHILSLLRVALKRYISNKYKRDNVLVVYLLDNQIETRIMQEKPLNDEERDQLIKAFSGEVGDLPMASQNPIILTTLEIRKKLKNQIEKEFPRVAVLCYQELSPDLNIQPIARITWN